MSIDIPHVLRHVYVYSSYFMFIYLSYFTLIYISLFVRVSSVDVLIYAQFKLNRTCLQFHLLVAGLLTVALSD